MSTAKRRWPRWVICGGLAVYVLAGVALSSKKPQSAQVTLMPISFGCPVVAPLTPDVTPVTHDEQVTARTVICSIAEGSPDQQGLTFLNMFGPDQLLQEWHYTRERAHKVLCAAKADYKAGLWDERDCDYYLLPLVWYLMVPPTSRTSEGNRIMMIGADLSEWAIYDSFDTPSACRKAYGRFHNLYGDLVLRKGKVREQLLQFSKCIESDDPRLKKN